MNTTGKIFRGIGAVFILAVILVWFIYHKVVYGGDKKEQDTATTTTLKYGVGTEILMVGDKPSKRIEVNRLGTPHQYNIVIGAMSDDIPFICIYNGGEEKGGWETYIPARRDWAKLNFKFIDYPNRVIYVNLKVPEGTPDSQIYYTISRK